MKIADAASLKFRSPLHDLPNGVGRDPRLDSGRSMGFLGHCEFSWPIVYGILPKHSKFFRNPPRPFKKAILSQPLFAENRHPSTNFYTCKVNASADSRGGMNRRHGYGRSEPGGFRLISTARSRRSGPRVSVLVSSSPYLNNARAARSDRPGDAAAERCRTCPNTAFIPRSRPDPAPNWKTHASLFPPVRGGEAAACPSSRRGWSVGSWPTSRPRRLRIAPPARWGAVIYDFLAQ